MTQNQAQNQDILFILSRIETRLSNVEKKLGIQNTFEKLEQKNPSEFQDFYFSSIIKKDDIPLILSWMPKKVKNFELLYDSIKDGSNAGAFHKKCYTKKPTITFVKTKKTEDLEDILKKLGMNPMEIISQMRVRFYFLLKKKKNILYHSLNILFIIMQVMDQLLEVDMIYI